MSGFALSGSRVARLLAAALVAVTAAAAAGAVARAAAAPPVDNSGHLYVLDGWGGVHAVGSSPALATTAYWQGWDIARGLALFPDGSGGYVLDGWGNLHTVGTAPDLNAGASWSGWDIARGIALLPATGAGAGGYVLDGWGGLHAFGAAPARQPSAYWPRFDIARGIALLPDGTGGYTLDGYGAVHPFGSAPPVAVSAYWPAWDIARGITVLPGSTSSSAGGYVVDGWGGLHPFGSAPAVVPSSYTAGSDLTRGVVAWTAAPAGSPGGWTLDGYGGVHAFGGAPDPQWTAPWTGWDIARGLAAGSGGSGVRSVVTGGRILDVQFARQQYALDCEAASLQTALSHEGLFRGQTQLLDAMVIDWRAGYYDYSGTLHWGDPYQNFVGNPNGSEVNLTGYGTYYSDVAWVAHAEGGTVVESGTGITPSDLYSKVLAGHPAVVWVPSDWVHRGLSYWIAFDGRRVPWAGPSEHAVTVVGVSSTSVYVYNPASGPQWISKATFESAYSTYQDMAVVIS